VRSQALNRGQERASGRIQVWRRGWRPGIRGFGLADNASAPKSRRISHGLMTLALVLLLTGVWPVFLFHSWFSEVLPPNFIGAVTVALGGIVGLAVLADRRRPWLFVESPALLFLPVGLGFVAVLTSFPLDRLGLMRLSLFFLVSVPCFYAALICSKEQLHSLLIVAAFPVACVVLVTGEPPGGMNPIAAGWVLMLAAVLCVPGSRQGWLLSKLLLAGLYTVTIVTLEELGPVVALVVALLFVVLTAADRSSRVARRVVARPLPLLASAALGWVVLMLALSQLEPRLADNHDTLAVRTDSLIAVMEERPLLGVGVSAFSESTVGEFYGERYPHNYVAEAFYSGGALGLAFMILLTVMALRRTIQAREAPRAAYVGVAVASLFSAGLYENHFLWFALGAMLRRPPRMRVDQARSHASSRAPVTAA